MNRAKYNSRITMLLGLVTFLGFYSCEEDNGNGVHVKNIWTIDLNSQLENPGVPGRSETGIMEMILFTDNSVSFSFQIENLKQGDTLTMVHIHAGDPITNGSVVQDFNPTISGSTGAGLLTLRPTFVDSLLNKEVELYFNIHSKQIPGGLVRGQVNSNILLASTVALSGANETPLVETTASGTALLRLATDKKLYYSVIVNNLEPSDALTMAHIHKGGAAAPGPVLVPLYASAADFGVKKILPLDDATITTLLTDSTYVNAHSIAHGPGVVRGQVKNESQSHLH